jgi:hypothetical protein
MTDGFMSECHMPNLPGGLMQIVNALPEPQRRDVVAEYQRLPLKEQEQRAMLGAWLPIEKVWQPLEGAVTAVFGDGITYVAQERHGHIYEPYRPGYMRRAVRFMLEHDTFHGYVPATATFNPKNALIGARLASFRYALCLAIGEPLEMHFGSHTPDITPVVLFTEEGHFAKNLPTDQRMTSLFHKPGSQMTQLFYETGE